MARSYAGEMARLAETFAWASATDLQPLRQAVRIAGLSPLRAIGSGGSLTSAHALASLHRRYTGHVAMVATPLEAVNEPLDTTVATWLLSAGGSNVDIMAVAKTLILREPRQLGVLCGRDTSPLAKLCRQHPFVDLLLYVPPAGRDGFLATNSLLGFVILLTRAYTAEFGSDADWQNTVDCLEPLVSDTAVTSEAWKAATMPLLARSTTLVLHGPSTRIGALDLESKFTEAALGHLQLADYRNFAHGRHHWLAKRSETSSVLAFITNEDRALAERTLDLIPKDVPRARILFEGSRDAVAMSSLVAALRIAGWAGLVRGIDPGRPGVPEFGRKLYSLPFPCSCRVTGSPRLTPRQTAAITRKAGLDPDSLAALGTLDRWCDALGVFSTGLRNARFAGIVLDYDGTVVDTRHRFKPASPEMVTELSRIIETGVHVAIATGRGQSVRHDLQSVLPPSIWPFVIVGYYNGAEVAPLDDDRTPDGSQHVCTALQPITEALRHQPELSEYVHQEHRPFQITLRVNRVMPDCRLWELVNQLILLAGATDVRVTRSGHAIDILAPGVSKLNTVKRLREALGDSPIVAIGDRGRWPGNDYELLSVPFALGVDEINADPSTCWHLGKPGQRGTAVTLNYLSALEADDSHLRFNMGSLQ